MPIALQMGIGMVRQAKKVIAPVRMRKSFQRCGPATSMKKKCKSDSMIE